MDHMDVMGGTLDLIAYEKAGVIKRNLPCVIGPTCSDKQPILDYAKTQNAELIKISQ